MTLELQCISLLFSFLYGVFLFLMFHFYCKYFIKKKFKLLAIFLYCICFSLLYFYCLLCINDGFLHYSLLLFIIFGFLLTYQVFKKYVK